VTLYCFNRLCLSCSLMIHEFPKRIVVTNTLVIICFFLYSKFKLFHLSLHILSFLTMGAHVDNLLEFVYNFGSLLCGRNHVCFRIHKILFNDIIAVIAFNDCWNFTLFPIVMPLTSHIVITRSYICSSFQSFFFSCWIGCICYRLMCVILYYYCD